MSEYIPGKNGTALEGRAENTEVTRRPDETGISGHDLKRFMEQLLQAMNANQRRMSELEKQLRLGMPLTRAMEQNVLAAIRAKAKELCSEYAPGNGRAAAITGREIRRGLYLHYGVRDIRSIPKHEYEIALERVSAARWTTRLGDLTRDAGGAKP